MLCGLSWVLPGDGASEVFVVLVAAHLSRSGIVVCLPNGRGRKHIHVMHEIDCIRPLGEWEATFILEA